MAGLNDKNNLPEGVEVNAQGVVSCTRDALNRLGDWCRQNAGALAISVFAATSTYAVLAQSLPPNPEYDRIIAEAQKQGKDPVDYALAKGKNEDWASKLDVYITKKAVIAQDGENEKKKQAVIAKKNEGKELDQELIKRTQEVLSSISRREQDGTFGEFDIKQLNEMYSSSIPKQARDMIMERFGKYIKVGSIAQL